MAADAVLAIKIVTDYAQGAAGLNAASSRAQKFGAGLKKLALPAGIALGAVVAFGKGAVDAASRTEQAMGGIDAVFGKNAGTVKQWAADAANSVGLSKGSYGELATVIGSQLKNAGFSMDEVTTKTGDLIKKGADLAAMYGGTTADAVAALSSTLKGETDPIEKYGASINEAAVKAEMAAHGWDNLTGAAEAQAKAQARMNLITEQTVDAEGAAAREHDTAAASSQRLAAQYENLQASLGKALLPAFVMFASLLSKLVGVMSKHTTATKVVIVVIAAMAVAILALNVAVGVYTAVTTLAASATVAAWAAALLPITLVIAGVLLVVGAIVLLWKRSATFRKIVLAVWKAIRTAAVAVARAFKATWVAALGAVRSVFSRVASTARAVWASIRSAAKNAVDGIKTVWRNMVDAVRSKLSSFRASAVAVWAAIRSAVGNVTSAIRETLTNAITSIKQAMTGLASKLTAPWAAMTTAVGKVSSALSTVVGWVKDLISWIGKIHIPKALTSLGGILGRSVAPAPAVRGVPTVGGFTAPRVGAMVGASSTGGAGLTVINVTGAMDPEAVARQIQRVTSGHRRRVGLRT